MRNWYLSGEFARNLRKLNPNLRVFCGDNDSKPAGLYRIVNGEYEDICGVDKNVVPEWPEFTDTGRIRKSGWRRVIGILLSRRIVKERDVTRVFGAKIGPSARLRPTIKASALHTAVMQGLTDKRDDAGSPIYSRSDVRDIAEAVRKENKNG